jgi:hypothetical protein
LVVGIEAKPLDLAGFGVKAHLGQRPFQIALGLALKRTSCTYEAVQLPVAA